MLRRWQIAITIISLSLIVCTSCAQDDSIESEEVESTITESVRPTETVNKPAEDDHRLVVESSEALISETEVTEYDPYVIDGIRIKTEEEIENDLINHQDFFPYQPVAINNLEITRRQTNTESMTDNVWISASVSNENIDCVIQYELNYNMYNSGWILDAVSPYERSTWSIIPLQGPSYELAFSALQDVLAQANHIASTGGIMVGQSAYNYIDSNC